MTTDELKNSIHEFLRYDRVFDLVLRKNPSLFADKLTSVDYKNYWFEYRANDIEIIGEPIIDDTKNYHGDFFYVYFSDFKFTGYLCHCDQS